MGERIVPSVVDLELIATERHARVREYGAKHGAPWCVASLAGSLTEARRGKGIFIRMYGRERGSLELGWARGALRRKLAADVWRLRRELAEGGATGEKMGVARKMFLGITDSPVRTWNGTAWVAKGESK